MKQEKTLGIYFGEDDIAEYKEIQTEAKKYRFRPSEYGRRLLRIGRKVVGEHPEQLLNA